jgi:hypothetical protein
MNRMTLLLGFALTLSHVLCAAEPALNALTDAEKKEGWTLLFDGESFKGSRASSCAENTSSTGSTARRSWSTTSREPR